MGVVVAVGVVGVEATRVFWQWGGTGGGEQKHWRYDKTAALPAMLAAGFQWV